MKTEYYSFHINYFIFIIVINCSSFEQKFIDFVKFVKILDEELRHKIHTVLNRRRFNKLLLLIF